jgi:mannan endo-1,4-beta-mannosidase
MLTKAFVVVFVILVVSTPFFSLSTQSVSASTNQIYWGTYVGDQSRMPLSTLQTFENQVNKGVSIWNWLQWWIDGTDQWHDPNFNFAWMNDCRNHGAIPMVSWAPSTILIAGRYAGYDDIISGKFDTYLDKWGSDSHTWGHPYFVRLFWEFNGQWAPEAQTPWANGGTPEKFVAMWQHVVDRVRAAGGTQISWIWCPAQLMESVSTLRTVYPGDNYVDWVGTDVYSTLDYAQTYLSTIRTVAPSKPVMLPEWGYGNYNGNTGAYWAQILSDLQTKYQYIKGFCLWEYPSANPSEELTVVDSATLSSFRQAISSNYYASNVYTNLNVSPLDAINETPKSTPPPISLSTPTPTHIYPTSLPTSTSTHSDAVPFGLGWLNIAIASVIAAIIVASVSLILRKRFMKNTT